VLSHVQRNYDWGTVGDHKFDVQQLSEMKKGCEPNCFSTLGTTSLTATAQLA